MSSAWFSIAFASVTSACLLYHVFLLVRSLWRLGLATAKRCVRQGLCNVAGWLWCCAKGKKEQTDEAKRLAELIRKEVNARREIYARWSVICISIMMSLAAVPLLGNIAKGAVREMAWYNDLVFMSTYLLASGLLAFRVLRRGRALNLWHCLLMLSVTVDPLGGRNVKNWDIGYTYVFVSCIFYGLINLNVSVSFFTNLIHLARMAYFYKQASEEDPNIQYSVLLAREVTMFCGKVGLLYCWELALVQGSKRQIEVKSERGYKSAVTSLLGMVCDSVVELDETLSFIEHVPSFASALFQGSGKSLQGEPLKRFICEGEDQELFEKSMRVQEDEPGPVQAQMFHAKLRDAWGNLVRMELFHVPFMNMDDRMHHLLGLREHSETHAAGSDADPGAAPAYESEPGGMAPILEESAGPAVCLAESVVAGLGAEHSPAAERRLATRSARSASSGSSQQTGASLANALQVDVVATSELPVQYASPEFKAKYGSPATIAELIPEATQFSQWLNSVADEVFSGTRLPKIEKFGNLKMGSGGATGAEPNDMWRVKVNFPSPFGRTSTGVNLSPDRSTYSVSVRLAKPQHAASGASASGPGTLASAGHLAPHGSLEEMTSTGSVSL